MMGICGLIEFECEQCKIKETSPNSVRYLRVQISSVEQSLGDESVERRGGGDDYVCHGKRTGVFCSRACVKLWVDGLIGLRGVYTSQKTRTGHHRGWW